MLTYGLGQTGKDGFRAFTLTGPDRLVVDLKHPAAAQPSAGSGTAVPAATEDGHTSAGIPGNASGELAETGARQAAPTALIGGLLVLGGVLLAAACAQVNRRTRA